MIEKQVSGLAVVNEKGELTDAISVRDCRASDWTVLIIKQYYFQFITLPL